MSRPVETRETGVHAPVQPAATRPLPATRLERRLIVAHHVLPIHQPLAHAFVALGVLLHFSKTHRAPNARWAPCAAAETAARAGADTPARPRRPTRCSRDDRGVRPEEECSGVPRVSPRCVPGGVPVVFRGAVGDEGGRTGRSIHGSGRDHRAAAVARESKRLLRYDDGDDAVWAGRSTDDGDGRRDGGGGGGSAFAPRVEECLRRRALRRRPRAFRRLRRPRSFLLGRLRRLGLGRLGRLGRLGLGRLGCLGRLGRLGLSLGFAPHVLHVVEEHAKRLVQPRGERIKQTLQFRRLLHRLANPLRKPPRERAVHVLRANARRLDGVGSAQRLAKRRRRRRRMVPRRPSMAPGIAAASARPVARRRTTRHGLIDRDDGSYPFTRAGSGSRDAEQEVSPDFRAIRARGTGVDPDWRGARRGQRRGRGIRRHVARDARVRERGRERNPSRSKSGSPRTKRSASAAWCLSAV